MGITKTPLTGITILDVPEIINGIALLIFGFIILTSSVILAFSNFAGLLGVGGGRRRRSMMMFILAIASFASAWGNLMVKNGHGSLL